MQRGEDRPAAAGLHRKGETVEEVAGAAGTAMRRHMTPIRTVAPCSSTPAAPAATARGPSTSAPPRPWSRPRPACRWPSTATAASPAAAARPTCWPRWASTSRPTSPRVEACLEELGICFCFAPLLHRAMKHVAAVRKRLGVPTIFNILGPLVNPAGAPFQLLGVGRAELQPLLAEALAPAWASQRALVVHGADGLDEVTLAGPTWVTETAGPAARFEWQPEDFGLRPAGIEECSSRPGRECPDHPRGARRPGRPGPRHRRGQRGRRRCGRPADAIRRRNVPCWLPRPSAAARPEILLARLAQRTNGR